MTRIPATHVGSLLCSQEVVDHLLSRERTGQALLAGIPAP